MPQMHLNKAVLMIIDGWGHRLERSGNAIAQACTPHYDKLCSHYSYTTLNASSLPVGLPDGVMGNSEVGHMNIGAGRRVLQEQVRINETISNGSFFEMPKLLDWVSSVRKENAHIHLIGLVSQGNVHSTEGHYFALLRLLRKLNFPQDHIHFHVITDGRDTAPKSALGYVKNLEEIIKMEGGSISSVSGRFYAMDRDTRWERTQKAVEMLLEGKGELFSTAAQAIHHAYNTGETDEFILPRCVGKHRSRIQSGDGVMFFNFRSDRMRQLVKVLSGLEQPQGWELTVPDILPCTMTQYDATFTNIPVLFAPQDLKMGLGEYLQCKHVRQFRTAETEKYAHVTFFFNGGREEPFEGESRILIPSPKVKTYDETPAMSSKLVTEAVVSRIVKGEEPLIVVNFAQPDMVGHTGIFDAAIAAVEATDLCIGEIVQACQDCGYYLFLTADHGNIEMMMDPNTGEVHTAHTTNPVPAIVMGPDVKGAKLLEGGALCDIAPTLLKLLGLAQPKEMTGQSILI